MRVKRNRWRYRQSGLLILLLFLIPYISNAQKINFGLNISPRYGFLIAHRATMEHLVQEHIYGIEVGGSIQTNGSKPWEQDYLYPKITFSAIFTSLGNSTILGYAMGVMGGIYLPFFRKNGWSFGSNLKAGVDYVTKRYDVKSNPKNNAIGSHVNSIVSLGLQLEKMFSQQSIGLEINLTHTSNGAYKLPNLGLNLPAVKLNYSYYLHPIHLLDSAVKERKGQPLHSWRFFTAVIASAKQIYPTGGNRYGVIGITNYTHYRFTRKCIVEGGIDFVYDASIVPYNGGEYKKSKNLTLGIYAAYVLPLHRLQLLVGMGRYLYKPLFPEGMWYHRFGARFKIINHLWGNITIKSRWAKADYFEYGLIYRW